MTELTFATGVVERLQHAGYVALFAGGCVRDRLLGLEPADYDVATSATPNDMKALFPRCHTFGASFGVVEVLGPRGEDGEWLKVQVATFRTDGTYTDGRRPDAVQFSTPQHDAERRDFTINGLFFDPIAGRVDDYVGGQVDLRARLLRAIGVPQERFAEDKLRLLRAVRMAARFELTIEPLTWSAIVAMAPQIAVVSAERIAEELRKMLLHPNRAKAIELLVESGLMEQILPEAFDLKTIGHTDTESTENVIQLAEVSSSFSVLSVTSVMRSSSLPFALYFAALLKSVDAPTAGKIGKRLKLSNEEIDRIVWLTAQRRALHDAGELKRSVLFPLLAHPASRDLIALLRFDGRMADADVCDEQLRIQPIEVLDPPPLLTGDDLRDKGLKPGPAFKPLLEAIRAKQLDGELRSHDEAIDFLRFTPLASQ